MNGYTVTVLGTEVIPMNEFKNKYNNYRQHRTEIVRQMRSQIFRQIA